MIILFKFFSIFLLILSLSNGAPSLDADEEEYFFGLKHSDVSDRKNDPEVEAYLSSFNRLSIPDSFDARDKVTNHSLA